jgi:hypothetical protein
MGRVETKPTSAFQIIAAKLMIANVQEGSGVEVANRDSDVR